MSCLVIAELENGTPNRPSLAAISASLELESTIDLLVLTLIKLMKLRKSKILKKFIHLKTKLII